jgi:hypothetical protein
MARGKENKRKQQAAKNAAAKLKKCLGVKDCDDLMDRMDKQDAEDSSPRRGRSKGLPKEDLSDDEEDAKEEEANEEEYQKAKEEEANEEEYVKAVEAIMNANIEDGTKHGYRLNLVRLVKFLYSKQSKTSKVSSSKKKPKIASLSGLLHENLVSDMDAVVAKKGSEKELSDAIHKHLLKANAEYHPIDLPQLDVPTFIGHLLALTKKKQ